ncbi:DUF427 domain-containing protein [Thioclava sp. BHET1]|nr:DUF427 domain-containing protein [Thioclava sp. BHET1]
MKAGGTWVIRAGGAILGESKEALELIEKNHQPVIYFPRADIAMAFLEPSETVTTCPYKGQASYFSIVTKSGTISDAAWCYEDPIEAASRIAGHLAFYPDKVALERI